MSDDKLNKHRGDEDDDDLDDDSSVDGGNTMMSLLSSYYGIQEENKEVTEVVSSSNIDVVGFNHQGYVKDLLLTKDVKDLLKEDVKMVHDIKTLDSDMQMLVYENYNKFISATETIKKMKTNVEAMDEDMESVRVKMGTITLKTTFIDQSLAEKRSKIDKLVRIKRLLNRLEFLSELPERLEKMIDQGMYKAAIQLYNKTLSVLKKQSHVLSFKKIQERTESMMIELRAKVLSLFDSQSLDTQQLTEYVDTLRMMGCPRDLIIEKFLAAHKYRSLKMMKSFRQEIDSAINARSTSGVPSSTPAALSVGNIRTFHQNLMVGLIETSKGIRDMFQENRASKVFIPTEQGGEGFTMTLAMAYDELQAMLGIVIPDYIQCVLKPLREFFSHYDRIMLLKENGQLDPPLPVTDDSAVTTDPDTDADSRPHAPPHAGALSGRNSDIIPNLEEERSIWISLTRQIILDCQYLDSGTEACRPPECDPSLPHADGVAESLLNTLDQHFDQLFDKKLDLLKSSILKAIPEFVTGSDCRAELAAEIESHEAPSARSVFNSRLQSRSSAIFDKLISTFDDVFGSISKDARQIVDTHSVSRVGIADSASHLIWRYCDSIAEIAESFGGAAIRPPGSQDIYNETISIEDPSFLKPCSDSDAHFCLISAVLFTKLLPTLTGRLDMILKGYQMSSTTSSFLRDRCSTRFESSAMLLLEAFIGYHASTCSKKLKLCIREASRTDAKARNELIEIRDLLVTKSVIDFTETIDRLASLCCLVLSESPPSAQVRLLGGGGGQNSGSGNDYNSGGTRRGSMMAGGRSSMQGHGQHYNYGLQLDIERMFSRKIKVFDTESLQLNTECILSTILKASLKSSLECLRLYSLGPLSYAQLMIDFTFLKQALSSFLKDYADIEGLSEEIYGTLSARCVEHTHDTEVPSILPRSVNDGLYLAGKRCVFLHR